MTPAQTRCNQRRTPEHIAWSNMIQRCYNRNNPRFADYGGRGIKICDRWRQFENFLADMGNRPPGLELDRENNNGDYTPTNCRWATRQQQCRNNRRNRLVVVGDRKVCIAEAAEIVGLPDHILRARILRYGWSLADALKTPFGRWNPARRARYA